MIATFYKLSKRLNSTKQPPSFDPGITKELRPYGVYSPLAPEFVIDDKSDLTDYNYIRIPHGDGEDNVPYYYYKINNWFFDGPYWHCATAIDLLATFKNVIGFSTQYVVRSTSNKDKDVVDTYYNAYTQSIRKTLTIPLPADKFSVQFTDGIFVIGILNDDAPQLGTGVSTYYVMTQAQMQKLMSALLKTPNILDNPDISPELLKNIVDPLQYITFCQWFPLKLDSLKQQSCIGSSPAKLSVGWWTSLDCDGYVITNTIWTYAPTISLATHPQIDRGTYLNKPPYTSYQCYFPGFGVFEIPADGIYYQGIIALHLSVDLITGASMLRILSNYLATPDDYREILVEYGQTGVDFALGQLRYGKQGSFVFSAAADTVESVPEFVGNLAVANMAGTAKKLGYDWTPEMDKAMHQVTDKALGAADKSAGLIGSGLKAADAVPTTRESTGSLIDYQHPITFYATFKILLPDEGPDVGYPLCKYVQIDTLSGFVQCKHSKLPMDYPADIQAALESMLDGGIYFD